MNKRILMVLTIFSLLLASHSKVEAQKFELDLKKGFKTITIDDLEISYHEKKRSIEIKSSKNDTIVIAFTDAKEQLNFINKDYTTTLDTEKSSITMNRQNVLSIASLFLYQCISIVLIINEKSGFILVPKGSFEESLTIAIEIEIEVMDNEEETIIIHITGY